MSDTVNNYGGGISFSGLLTALFIGLKLGHFITWPWLWVLSPLWIPLALIFAIGIVALVLYLIVSLVKAAWD